MSHGQINLISASPIEHEIYYDSPSLRALCDSVGQMIMDLHDESFDVDIVLGMNDTENPEEFMLAFSGTTLSMDFYPNKIEITDFELADSEETEVLQTFPPNNVNQATTWLVNEIHNRQ